MEAQGYIGIRRHGEKGKGYRFRTIAIQVLKEADESVQPSAK
jgi:hypothetical protein